MKPNPRLAARYAKSILDLSVEKGQLEAVYSDMQFLRDCCQQSRDLVSLLRSPIVKADKKDKILEALTAGKVNLITATFNRLLVSKGRESFLPEIAEAFIQQYKDLKEIYTVKLTTAGPVSEELKNSLVEKIKSGSSMQHIELNSVVDENIIGGFILEVGDRLVDASIAYDLNNVRKQFRNNDFVYQIR